MENVRAFCCLLDIETQHIECEMLFLYLSWWLKRMVSFHNRFIGKTWTSFYRRKKAHCWMMRFIFVHLPFYIDTHLIHFTLSYKLSALVSPSTIIAAQTHTKLHLLDAVVFFSYNLAGASVYVSILCLLLSLALPVRCLSTFVKQIISSCIPYHINAISFLVS